MNDQFDPSTRFSRLIDNRRLVDYVWQNKMTALFAIRIEVGGVGLYVETNGGIIHRSIIIFIENIGDVVESTDNYHKVAIIITRSTWFI